MKLNLIIAFYYIFFSFTAQAQIVNSLGSNNNGREYFVGMGMGKPLFTVNLVNGVSVPGVYHIPAETNLAELFSYAGGTLTESDLEHVVIRSVSPSGQFSVKTYNFAHSMFASEDAFPRLSDKDIIQIEQNQSLERTLKWMTLAALATSIVSAIIVINNNK